MCTALHSLLRSFHSSHLLFLKLNWEARPFRFMDQNWGLKLGIFTKVLQPLI